jgi:hypothetical protein
MTVITQEMEQALSIIKEKLNKKETLENEDFLLLFLASIMEEDVKK